MIIDGGANIGEYSRRAAEFVKGCRIYSFEPVKNTFNRLVKNLKDYESLIPVNKGLYHENGVKNINLFPSHTHSSLYDLQGLSYDPVNTAEIELITGDTFMEQIGIAYIDLLKLDQEGAEYDALLGFENALKKAKLKWCNLNSVISISPPRNC